MARLRHFAVCVGDLERSAKFYAEVFDLKQVGRERHALVCRSKRRRFGVFVERGAVSVIAAGQEVDLLMGQGTDIDRPRAIPTTTRRWREPRIGDALASVF